MLRKLVDYKKLDHSLAALLIETYPNGYGDDDTIIFKNGQGETIEAVELKTPDAIYLVKISKSLSNFIANFEDNMEKELETESEAEPVMHKVGPSEFDSDYESDFENDEDFD